MLICLRIIQRYLLDTSLTETAHFAIVRVRFVSALAFSYLNLLNSFAFRKKLIKMSNETLKSIPNCSELFHGTKVFPTILASKWWLFYFFVSYFSSELQCVNDHIHTGFKSRERAFTFYQLTLFFSILDIILHVKWMKKNISDAIVLSSQRVHCVRAHALSSQKVGGNIFKMEIPLK